MLRWFHVEPQGGLPYTPPLDAANAAAAYSVRKLRTAYEGPCIRVSDNPIFSGATKDVGFDSNGYLDVASLYPFSYVRKWYDQTGNGLDFVQNTAGDTPIIQLSGVLQTVNGLAALKFDGVNDSLSILSSTGSFRFLHDGSSSNLFMVHQVGLITDPGLTYIILDNTGSFATIGVLYTYSDAGSRNNDFLFRVTNGSGNPSVDAQTTNGLQSNTQVLTYGAIDANNATASNRFTGQINNGSLINTNTATTAPSLANATYNLTLGQFAQGSTSNNLAGFFQELIIYDTDQSANKATLQNNINSYFSIY